MNILYKIVSVPNWTQFVKSGSHKCYGFDNDLTYGFIHLCTLNQMNEVIEKKYKHDNAYFKIDIDSRKVLGIKWKLYKRIYYANIYSVNEYDDPFIPTEAILSTELINRPR